MSKARLHFSPRVLHSLELTNPYPGVRVGQVTVHDGPDIHTGLTIIMPRGAKDTTTLPCYAATHDLNGMGELTGTHSLTEWGFMNGVRVPSI